jgi:hypothetical protein
LTAPALLPPTQIGGGRSGLGPVATSSKRAKVPANEIHSSAQACSVSATWSEIIAKWYPPLSARSAQSRKVAGVAAEP